MTGRRPYRMGKRQAAVDETKRRILEAASAEYEQNGVPDTSMQAVARRADVAPGTVLYHYPTPDDLASAVVETWIEQMEAPSPESIEPSDPLEGRVHDLVREVFSLYGRSDAAYRVYQKSPDHPVFAEYETWWYDNVGQMMVRALGEHAGDQEIVAIVSALIDPGFRGMLIGRGLSEERAVEVAKDLVLSRLEG